MKKHILVITTSVFMLLGVATDARSQTTTAPPSGQEQSQAHQAGPGMMGSSMMRPGGLMSMMGEGGMMRHGGTSGPVMRIIFALMDGDGDGTVSLQEFQAAHERIFKAMDTNKDGVLTLEEIQSFMLGRRRPGQ